jgi:hypothetical protein
MANNLKTSIVSRNAALDAIRVLANSGLLRIYDGSQPATPETAVSTQTLLAELTMNATAFGAASGGIITAAAITSDSANNATGTAAWFRLLKSDGTTVIVDGSVAATGGTADLLINTVSLVINAQTDVTAFTLTMPQ